MTEDYLRAKLDEGKEYAGRILKILEQGNTALVEWFDGHRDSHVQLRHLRLANGERPVSGEDHDWRELMEGARE